MQSSDGRTIRRMYYGDGRRTDSERHKGAVAGGLPLPDQTDCGRGRVRREGAARTMNTVLIAKKYTSCEVAMSTLCSFD